MKKTVHHKIDIFLWLPSEKGGSWGESHFQGLLLQSPAGNPVIPVDYFDGYHIMQMLKIKSIIDNFVN
jgi:hypothetical protein